MSLDDLFECKVWTIPTALAHIQARSGKALVDDDSFNLQRALGIPDQAHIDSLKDSEGRDLKVQVLEREIELAREKKLVIFVQTFTLPNGRKSLCVFNLEGELHWVPYLSTIAEPMFQLRAYFAQDLFVVASDPIHSEVCELAIPGVFYPIYSRLSTDSHFQQKKPATPVVYPHLRTLEDESIFIIREALAEGSNPALLYSIGKDSSVLLHLLMKALHPAPLPVPLVHVDTRFKFQEMYAFREFVARSHNLKLITHVNPEALAKDINPFDHGSQIHTDVTKTHGLKQVLRAHSFDVVFGGARRDEEKSRAKERVFSLRSSEQAWDPRTQRPELWQLYNTRLKLGESFRVFPLSNWTELDVWKYIHQENIPVVPLYFSKIRPVVRRDGMLLVINDNRLRLLKGEAIEFLPVRFRTLGCYPLTSAIESDAVSVAEIIRELEITSFSERQGRRIDFDVSGAMELKKREGYF